MEFTRADGCDGIDIHSTNKINNLSTFHISCKAGTLQLYDATNNAGRYDGGWFYGAAFSFYLHREKSSLLILELIERPKFI